MHKQLQNCRSCGIWDYYLTENQLKKHDYLCKKCRSIDNQLYKQGKKIRRRVHRPYAYIQPFLTRIFSRVEKTESCWLWLGATNSGYGYINFPRQSRMGAVHAILYRYFVGPVPKGKELDHLCRVRNCVNPAHLEPVSRRENTLRGMAPNAISVRTNSCYRGHKFTLENTYFNRGKRHCQTCRKVARERWRVRAALSA